MNHAGATTPDPVRDARPREKLLLTAGEAAELIGVSRSKFFELASAGRLPRPVRLGARCPRWVLSEMRAWIAAGAPDTRSWERIKKNLPQNSADRFDSARD